MRLSTLIQAMIIVVLTVGVFGCSPSPTDTQPLKINDYNLS